MSEAARSYLFDMTVRGDWVRLRTLVVLRWVAVIGQSVAVLIASQLLGFQLQLAYCALLISGSVMVNLVAITMFPAETRLTEQGTWASLCFDLVQLVALLMVTGGLNNPFALLILAPVTISATALRLQPTLLLGIMAMGFVTVMSTIHMPLIQSDGTPLEVPELFRSGISAALAIGVVFLSLYARRVTVEGYAMSQALTATQVALAREQRLAAIGGLAAAAAHELGTPLATIKLAASELARELADRPDLAEDARLIRAEAERCGGIMADLSRTGRDDSHVKTAPISAVLEEAAAPHAARGKRVILRIDGRPAEDTGERQPSVRRTPEFIHGMRNLVQNAVDFAATTVWIDVEHGEDRLRIAVGDDGPGFSPEMLPRLGEPYVSTRARGQRRRNDGEYEGMGLGLFIARTLLARTGARISFANGTDPRGRRATAAAGPPEEARPPGAIIELVWNADDIVVDKAATRRALGPNEPANHPL
ncbi:ActS/PrrB/RegB family redox-sensitive histidine kinase [Limibaculum sp. M0105]|uniref:histidine kinase n=1 Tax=Thermohalobaculum xanthum TaxID=2753746 RepID=A0A8J7M6I8_9RHOB|nr:ActS/PrrB/RegB family redox-sensitive histidine kinase [Thermohalobaculum xanthum]MBK0399100.1 ActS/PrrB/RegB family redox-sensitive histidine kinase [Thermohalobaculum xanthum]